MKVPLEINDYYVGYGDAMEGRSATPTHETPTHETYMAGYAKGSMDRQEAEMAQAARGIDFGSYQ